MSKESQDRPHQQRRHKNTTLPVCLGLGLIVVVVYAQVGWHEFVNFDDPIYVYENPRVRSGLSWESARWAFTDSYAANWHPLTWLSLMLDAQIYGQDASGFHVTNMLLHLANVLLVLAVLRQMTGALWRSALVAALFAVHPLHVESVAWVTERKDVLCVLFWMLTLSAYAFYARHGGVGRYLLVAIILALGLMAKSMLVTLPCVLLLLDFWPLGRLRFRLRTTSPTASTCQTPSWEVGTVLLEKVPLLALSAASSAITVLSQRSGGTLYALEHLPIAARMVNAPIAYLVYLGKMLWPAKLACFYPLPQSLIHATPATLMMAAVAAGLLLVVLSCLAFYFARRRPYLAVGWFWYLGTLIPVIGLVQVGMQSTADRYTYVPLLGIYIVIAWGAADLVQRRPRLRLAVAATSLLVLGTLATAAWFQASTWRNSLALFNHALRVTTENYVALNNLGTALHALGRHEEALAHFQDALRINPDYAEALNNLGIALAALGRPEAALAHYQDALRIKPDYAGARNNLGIALRALGRHEEALVHFQDALRIKPDYAEALNNLGIALKDLGRPEEALEHYQHALRIKPDDAEALNNLGNALAALGRPEEALAHYQHALRIKPDFAEAHYNLGNALVAMRRLEEALAHYQHALRIKPDFAKAHFNCGAVYWQLGKHKLAEKNFDKAIELKPELQSHPQLYKASKRYRQKAGK